jgi:hypothetical protein
MPRTVADQFADVHATAGVKRAYGIVGDSSNGLTDAIRRHGKIGLMPLDLAISCRVVRGKVRQNEHD